VAVSFIGGRKPEKPEKTIDLSQATDKFNVVMGTPHHEQGWNSQL
jgi:hypothetical protein